VDVAVQVVAALSPESRAGHDQNWVRLVHAVTENADAFRMITDKQERHELVIGKDPWDIIAEAFNKADYKPEPHRVGAPHP
jgi:hypothetical protein